MIIGQLVLAMTGADLALAALINRTTTAFTTRAPKFITYTEYSHIVGNGQSRDINRTISVRVADDFAVMRDLPEGAERTGEAFPVIPYLDLFSQFQYCWFANLKRVDITYIQGAPWYLQLPAPDPGVDAQIAYFSQFAPRYAADSSDSAIHLVIDPTPKLKDRNVYPMEVREDPDSHLPSHVSIGFVGSDETLSIDYAMTQGYWVATRAVWSATQRVFVSTFKVTASTTFSNFSFPDSPPDPRLSTNPSPIPAATCPPG